MGPEHGAPDSLLCAMNGYKTKCSDVIPEMLKKADNFVNTYLPGRVEKGKMTKEQAEAARKNISFTGDMKEASKDADFVIEAATEVLDLKKKIFADLDKFTPAHAILATNSSFIVSSLIAGVTKKPEKVLNMHFFNPALVMKLVEVVKGPHVSQETADITMELCKKMEKVPVFIKKEVDGFLLNRIFRVISEKPFGCSKWASPPLKISTRRVFMGPAIRWVPSVSWTSPESTSPISCRLKTSKRLAISKSCLLRAS